MIDNLFILAWFRTPKELKVTEVIYIRDRPPNLFIQFNRLEIILKLFPLIIDSNDC